jgi:UDP-GlcNAc:undecaprenyl-phosphate GlcNAc-1-phosphate transferase
MGDAGAMFCGYFLATIAVLGTFHVEGTPRIAVAAPLLALAVPLFDMVSVLLIRWKKGAPLMKGDRRHFSHRLVDLGMSPRQAVEFILLVAGIIGLGGAFLPLLDARGTAIVLLQTVGVFLLIVLLMRAGKDSGGSVR